MECIEGCQNSQCLKDADCQRVQAMAGFIVEAQKTPPYTTTLPEVVDKGGITLDQWRVGYGNEETPCFKRAVEELLGGTIVYETSGEMGKNAVGVRRLTIFRHD